MVRRVDSVSMLEQNRAFVNRLLPVHEFFRTHLFKLRLSLEMQVSHIRFVFERPLK